MQLLSLLLFNTFFELNCSSQDLANYFCCDINFTPRLISVPVYLQTWDVQLSCGEGDWQNNTLVTITCLVKESSYPDKCVSPPPGTAEFRISKNGGQPVTRCTVPSVTTCSSTGSGTEGFCNCKNRDGTYYTLEHTFKATDSDAGTWDCNVLCFNVADPVLTVTSVDCDNKGITGNPYDISLSLPLGICSRLAVILSPH
ncbi:hypothetical protein BaRGS_00023196 [Batillaria attramentaria]|uniref:Uncharacterized protein n=1 Tax=Batillaria attramentaria TaxID=370345 RepID=A0ABD0KEG3_9CAEN